MVEQEHENIRGFGGEGGGGEYSACYCSVGQWYEIKKLNKKKKQWKK